MVGLTGRLRRAMTACLLACGLFVPAPAGAAEPAALEGVRARLEQHALVRADFVQTKQMAALKRPLVTSGRLLVSRRDGVLWQIEQPYRITYALTQERIVEIAADGSRSVRTAREVPGLAQVGRVFRALLSADTAALAEYFDASAREDGARWELALRPRQAQVAQHLHALHIAGGEFVDSVGLEEAGGDSTRIRFRNSRSGSTLTAEERRLLAGE